MGRAPCCDERVALKKGPWTPDEDLKLVAYVQEHGHGSWRALPEKAGLARCGKSCRLRWTNYLRPDIKRGRFSQEEDQMIIQLHAILGNRWSAIASHLPRRTDNEIKNYWNTHLKKRLAQMGVDPVTHKTSSSSAGLALSPLVSTQLTHSSQWHCALAEAQARLSRSAPNSLPSAPAPHPSSLFMRSWKTNVQASLRPAFGTVKLEPTQKSRQDWSTALGLENYSQAMAPFPSQIRNASLVVLEDLGIENHFSPTSILHGPDSDSCGGSGDDFDFLHQDQGSSYQSFPLIDEHADSASMEDDIPESFWQGAVQQAESLLEDLKTVGALEAELIIPLGFDPEF